VEKIIGMGLRKSALIVAPMINQVRQDLFSGLKQGGKSEQFLIDEIEKAFSLKNKDEESDMIILLNAVCDGSFKEFQVLRDAIEKRSKALLKKVLKAGLKRPIDLEGLGRAIEHAEGYRR